MGELSMGMANKYFDIIHDVPIVTPQSVYGL